MKYAKLVNGEIELSEVKVGILGSYYDVLEYMSEDNEIKNGFVMCEDGIVEISGECSEEIEFIEFNKFEGELI